MSVKVNTGFMKSADVPTEGEFRVFRGEHARSRCIATRDLLLAAGTIVLRAAFAGNGKFVAVTQQSREGLLLSAATDDLESAEQFDVLPGSDRDSVQLRTGNGMYVGVTNKNGDTKLTLCAFLRQAEEFCIGICGDYIGLRTAENTGHTYVGTDANDGCILKANALVLDDWESFAWIPAPKRWAATKQIREIEELLSNVRNELEKTAESLPNRARDLLQEVVDTGLRDLEERIRTPLSLEKRVQAVETGLQELQSTIERTHSEAMSSADHAVGELRDHCKKKLEEIRGWADEKFAEAEKNIGEIRISGAEFREEWKKTAEELSGEAMGAAEMAVGDSRGHCERRLEEMRVWAEKRFAEAEKNAEESRSIEAELHQELERAAKEFAQQKPIASASCRSQEQEIRELREQLEALSGRIEQKAAEADELLRQVQSLPHVRGFWGRMRWLFSGSADRTESKKKRGKP
jgi:hypothetical protein